MTILPLIENDFEFEFGPYRLSPEQRVDGSRRALAALDEAMQANRRDPEAMSPYGAQNHALPPVQPKGESHE